MASDCMKLGLIFGQTQKGSLHFPTVAKGVTALLERDKNSGKQKGGDFPTHIIIPTFAERSFLLSTPTESLKKLFHGRVFYT